MATFQSTIFSSIHRSLAGLSFSTTVNGQVIGFARKPGFKYPTNSRNQQRCLFTTASAKWVSLSQHKRNHWNIYALTLSEQISGRKAFIRMYICSHIFVRTFPMTNVLSNNVPLFPSAINLTSVNYPQMSSYLNKILIKFSADFDYIDGYLRSNICLFYLSISRAFSRSITHNNSHLTFSKRQGQYCWSGASPTIVFSGLLPNSSYFFHLVFLRKIDGVQVSQPIRFRCYTRS